MSNGFMYGTPTGTPLFKFDIENSSGTSVGGGEVWKGKQVLSDNNYTATWTQELSAPKGEGTYSVLVYSAGAAADYIYCKMQMNGRTNGPKTSLVVAAMAKSIGFTSSLLAGSLFAIGGFFIFMVLRRREEETALN